MIHNNAVLISAAFPKVLLLLLAVVALCAYLCLLPHKLRLSLPQTAAHFICGNYVFCNVVFHYFSAMFKSPGVVKDSLRLQVSASRCLRCSSLRPPRAHHCSVCRGCVLLYDHHCPWINNCVGFYNRRHFFLFMAFMSLGCCYLYFFASFELNQHLENVDEYKWITINKMIKSFHYASVIVLRYSILLGILMLIMTIWHAKLISLGETSIEVYINRNLSKYWKMNGLIYKNPYNLGYYDNWCSFLFGSDYSPHLPISTVRFCTLFFKHIIIPSNVAPFGNGQKFHLHRLYNIENVLSDLV